MQEPIFEDHSECSPEVLHVTGQATPTSLAVAAQSSSPAVWKAAAVASNREMMEAAGMRTWGEQMKEQCKNKLAVVSVEAVAVELLAPGALPGSEAAELGVPVLALRLGDLMPKGM